MAGTPWTNQAVSLIVLTEQTTGFSGIFGYSPTIGHGNLIFSLAAAAGTDPYGNTYPQGLSSTLGNISGTTFSGTDYVINSSGEFFYSGTPAAGNLVSSITNSAGADSFGNNYLAGSSTYDNGSGIATSLAAGFVAFYSGSLAGGWTALSSVAGDVAGNLQVNAGGQLQLIGSGGITLNGSSSTGGPNPTQSGLVTTGPSATTSSFPAAAAGHTHTLNFFLPTANHTHTL